MRSQQMFIYMQGLGLGCFPVQVLGKKTVKHVCLETTVPLRVVDQGPWIM